MYDWEKDLFGIFDTHYAVLMPNVVNELMY